MATQIHALIQQHPTFGYRHIWALLRGQGRLVNRKAVYRVLKLKRWLVHQRPRIMRGYRQCLAHLSESFQGKRLSQISAFDVERHKKRRMEAHARVRANREVAVLKTLFNRCKDWGFYEGDNPATAVKKFEEPRRRLRYLEPDEEGRLLAAAAEPLRSLIVAGVNTGLRIGAEALTLRWADVDLDRGTLTVLAAYAKNKQTRTVNLNSRAVEALAALKATAHGEYVFSQRTGQPYRSMEKPFAKACARAGLAGSGVTLHTLRHTFVSRLVMAGVDLRTVQELGGGRPVHGSTVCSRQPRAQGESC